MMPGRLSRGISMSENITDSEDTARSLLLQAMVRHNSILLEVYEYEFFS